MPNVGSKSGGVLAMEVGDGGSGSSSSSSSSSGSSRMTVLVFPLVLEGMEVVGGIVVGVTTALKAVYHRLHSPCVGSMLVVAGTEEGEIPGDVEASR